MLEAVWVHVASIFSSRIYSEAEQRLTHFILEVDPRTTVLGSTSRVGSTSRMGVQPKSTVTVGPAAQNPFKSRPNHQNNIKSQRRSKRKGLGQGAEPRVGPRVPPQAPASFFCARRRRQRSPTGRSPPEGRRLLAQKNEAGA